MQAAPRTEIHRDELMSRADYERVRADRRAEVETIERDRRLPLGPTALIKFESYASAWLRCHERLLATDEAEAALAEANATIPRGHELVARLAPEDLAGAVSLQFAGEVVPGAAEPGGLVRFRLSPGQAERFRQPHVQVVVGSDEHLVAMPEAMRQSLARDLS